MRTFLIIIVAALIGVGIAQLANYLDAPKPEGGGSGGYSTNRVGSTHEKGGAR